MSSENLNAIEQTQLRRKYRVDGVGRPKFDFHTGVRGLVHALRGRLRRAADLFVRRRGFVFCPGDAAGGADGALGIESNFGDSL